MTTKAELIDAVASSAGVSKADAERTIGAFFDHVVATTKKGDKVAWPGFGSFQTSGVLPAPPEPADGRAGEDRRFDGDRFSPAHAQRRIEHQEEEVT